jgi:transposase
MVVHFVPAHRVVVLLKSLTGIAPSVGFCHGLLARTAALLTAVHALGSGDPWPPR